MNEKELMGKNVVSMAEGAKVGTIKDLVFSGLQLHGLIIKGEHGEGLLLIQNLGGVGPDAITIESYKIVDWNAGKSLAPELKSLHDLRKLNVVNDAGHEIGKLHDIVIALSGEIEQIEVRTEGVFGIGSHQTLVPASQIRALGPTLITVEVAPTPASS